MPSLPSLRHNRKPSSYLPQLLHLREEALAGRYQRASRNGQHRRARALPWVRLLSLPLALHAPLVAATLDHQPRLPRHPTDTLPLAEAQTHSEMR